MTAGWDSISKNVVKIPASNDIMILLLSVFSQQQAFTTTGSEAPLKPKMTSHCHNVIKTAFSIMLVWIASIHRAMTSRWWLLAAQETRYDNRLITCHLFCWHQLSHRRLGFKMLGALLTNVLLAAAAVASSASPESWCRTEQFSQQQQQQSALPLTLPVVAVAHSLHGIDVHMQVELSGCQYIMQLLYLVHQTSNK